MYEKMIQRLRETSMDFGEVDHVSVLLLEAADAIEELSKRETPTSVRITTSTKRCPSCNKQVSGRGNIHGNYRYCRWCGQALDWTEPPKEET